MYKRQDLYKQATSYASITDNVEAHHETAMRVAMLAVAKKAVQYGFKIKPLFAFNGSFMFKLYIHVQKISPKGSCPFHKESFYMFCPECMFVETQESFKSQSNCIVCDTPLIRQGPIWGKPLFSLSFVQEVKKVFEQNENKYIAKKKIEEILHTIKGEASLGNDLLTPYSIYFLSKFLKCNPPSLLWIK